MEIKRDIHLKHLIESMHNGMIKVVTGIRRCGKSYLLFNIFDAFLRKQGIDDNHIIKIDLEDRRNAKLREPDALMSYIDGKMVDRSMYYILLDEVQKVAEFEDVLNSYLKLDNADVYVTGSNSKFLSTDVITEFRGRGDEIHISPLCFSEFLSCWEGSKEDALKEYLTYGGLPKLVSIQSEPKKIQYLRDLFTKTYLTDIKERYSIKNDSDLLELIEILASNVGGLTNPTKLANTFASVKQSHLSRHTIESYLRIMQEAFVVEKSIRYDIKGKKYIDTPSKYYFTDLGLRNARLNFRQFEMTHLMENLIYNELRFRGMSVDVGELSFYTRDDNGKTQRKSLEVDFVCNQGSKRYYIQSALRLPDEVKREQELRSLKLIDDNFQKVIITEDPIHKYQDVNGVVFMNVYDFLMDENSLSS